MSQIDSYDFARYVESCKESLNTVLNAKQITISRSKSLASHIVQVASLPSKEIIQPMSSDNYFSEFANIMEDYENDNLLVENGGEYNACIFCLFSDIGETTYIDKAYVGATKYLDVFSDGQTISSGNDQDYTKTWDTTKDLLREDGTKYRWLKRYIKHSANSNISCNLCLGKSTSSTTDYSIIGVLYNGCGLNNLVTNLNSISLEFLGIGSNATISSIGTQWNVTVDSRIYENYIFRMLNFESVYCPLRYIKSYNNNLYFRIWQPSIYLKIVDANVFDFVNGTNNLVKIRLVSLPTLTNRTIQITNNLFQRANSGAGAKIVTSDSYIIPDSYYQSWTYLNDTISSLYQLCSKSGIVFKSLTLAIQTSTIANKVINLSRITENLIVLTDGIVPDMNSAELKTFSCLDTFKNNFTLNAQKLTNAALDYLIMKLDNFTGSTAKVITMPRLMYNKFTASQLESISAKNWTITINN